MPKEVETTRDEQVNELGLVAYGEAGTNQSRERIRSTQRSNTARS